MNCQSSSNARLYTLLGPSDSCATFQQWIPLLEINRTVVVYLPTYISMHRTRVEFLVP